MLAQVQAHQGLELLAAHISMCLLEFSINTAFCQWTVLIKLPFVHSEWKINRDTDQLILP